MRSVLQGGGDEWLIKGDNGGGCDDVKGWAGMARRRSGELCVAEVTLSVDAGGSIVAVIKV